MGGNYSNPVHCYTPAACVISRIIYLSTHISSRWVCVKINTFLDPQSLSINVSCPSFRPPSIMPLDHNNRGKGGWDNKSTYFRWRWHFPSNQDSWNLCLETNSFSFILSILDETLWVKFYTMFWHQWYFLLQKQQNEGGVKFQAGQDKIIWTCHVRQHKHFCC